MPRISACWTDLDGRLITDRDSHPPLSLFTGSSTGLERMRTPTKLLDCTIVLSMATRTASSSVATMWTRPATANTVRSLVRDNEARVQSPVTALRTLLAAPQATSAPRPRMRRSSAQHTISLSPSCRTCALWDKLLLPTDQNVSLSDLSPGRIDLTVADAPGDHSHSRRLVRAPPPAQSHCFRGSSLRRCGLCFRCS